MAVTRQAPVRTLAPARPGQSAITKLIATQAESKSTLSLTRPGRESTDLVPRLSRFHTQQTRDRLPGAADPVRAAPAGAGRGQWQWRWRRAGPRSPPRSVQPLRQRGGRRRSPLPPRPAVIYGAATTPLRGLLGPSLAGAPHTNPSPAVTSPCPFPRI